MKTVLNFFIAFVFIASIVQAQSDGETPLSPEEQYQKNIKKSYINKVYIPKNLEECFEELSALGDKNSINRFKNAEEEQVKLKLHSGLAKWMKIKWNLYDGSRISHYFRQQGVSHPDDIAQYVLVSYHRHLNGLPLELKQRAKEYQDYRFSKVKNKNNPTSEVSSQN